MSALVTLRARPRNLVPVWLSALVWPGAGQVYGGRRRRGIALIVLSSLLALTFSLVAAVCVLKVLPVDPAEWLDPGRIHLALRRVAADDTGTLWLAVAPLVAVWLYAIVDAWRDT
jgi:hypothetical protein